MAEPGPMPCAACKWAVEVWGSGEDETPMVCLWDLSQRTYHGRADGYSGFADLLPPGATDRSQGCDAWGGR